MGHAISHGHFLHFIFKITPTAIGGRPSVADWGSVMSASCRLGPVVCWRGQWMAA